MNSDGSVRGLELSGFKEETIQDVVYYVMKPGNLNKAWLTVLINILSRTIIETSIIFNFLHHFPNNEILIIFIYYLLYDL